jgi:hypothetical protein
MEEKKAVSIMSKKRYHLIEETLHKTVEDPVKVATVLQNIKEIMNFDPEAKQYNERVASHIRNYRQKVKAATQIAAT